MLDLIATMQAPERTLSLWAFLEAAAAGRGLVQVGPTIRTYREFADRTAALATGLRELGLGIGDRVTSIFSDRIENVELLFACAHVGAIYAPISPFLKGEFLSYQLTEISPKVLFVDAPGLAASAEFFPALAELVHVALVEEASHTSCPVPTGPSSVLYKATGHSAPETNGRLAVTMLYTSGTTGMPKGCLCSQGYFIKMGALLNHNLKITPADHLVTPFPLFHGAGLGGTLMGSLIQGASYHNTGRFSASTFMAEARAAGATIVHGPGAVGQALLAQPPRADDKRHAIRLAAWIPFPADGQAAFLERFGIPCHSEVFGQTECMMATQSHLDGPRKPGSCGTPTPMTEVAIVNDDGDQLPPGEMGEIVLRPRVSGSMFQGYWKKPEATVQAWDRLWHHTGDFGYFDADGFIYFVDRKKDAMRRRGENVSSVELEAAILKHPKIAEAAVHAVPSDMTEDDIKACLILKPDETVTAEELFAFFSATMPYFAIPRYVELFDAFPLTGSMKVRKEALRQRGVGEGWDFEQLGLSVAREDRRKSN